MNRIEVQAFEDRIRPEGGHAVILLCGLKKVPSSPAFRLRLVDPGLEADGSVALPDGKQFPVTARLTSEGMVLVIGPDVADHPMLTPGVAVEIQAPDAGVSGEFLWPSIASMGRPKRKSVLVRGPIRRDRADAGRTGSGSDAGAGPEILTAAPKPSQLQVASASDPLAGSAPVADRTPLHTVKEGPMKSPSTYQVPAAAELQAAGEPSDSRDTMARDLPHDGDTVFYPHARGSRTQAGAKARTDGKGRGLSSLMPASPLGMLTVILAGVAGLQAAIHLVQYNVLSPPQASLVGVPAVEATATPSATGSLFEALYPGPVSPRGVAANEISAAKALDMAQTYLQGAAGSRDADEGAFWLKRYLAGALGEDRNLRALTHLGSVYAKPTGRAPDYVKARMVWEMAGAFGDPVALCFVGALHENGLGVVRDSKKALQWYEAAKRTGGCPDVDASIARTRF